MTDTYTNISPSDLKDQARRLRIGLQEQGTRVTHSRALELIARQHGARDWNTLRATLNTTPPPAKWRIGGRVSGRYMGQPFTGVVKSLSVLSGKGDFRLGIHFDAPVDVVSFDSFSSLRSCVQATVNSEGVSHARRSDGTPHLVVERYAD